MQETVRHPIASSADRFLTFAFAAAELLVETDTEGRITFAEGAFPARFGRPGRTFLGHSVQELVARDLRSGMGTALELLNATGRIRPTAIRLSDRDRSAFSVAGLAAPGRSGRFCLTFSPLPDDLPGGPLPGGPGLARAAEEVLRRDDGPAALGLIELTGDGGALAPRADLAARIQAVLAAQGGTGTVAADFGAGRFGILPGEGMADLGQVAANVARLLAQHGLPGRIGTRALPLAGEGLSPLQATRALRFALSAFARGGDAALEKAGFAGGLAGFVDSAAERAAALRATIADRRFRLAFQPIVLLADRRPHHYEALLRPIPTPGTPFSEASEFIALAETVGLSEALDWAVVETACEAARAASGSRIACNLSGLSLQSHAFRDRLCGMLREAPALAERLLVEITETAEIEDEPEARHTVDALRDLGLPICLDDFGAGAAAFRYLRAFRVDFVKVDGIYVSNAVESARDRGFIAAMVDLARTVGAEVVAERIETEAQAALMRDLGVGFGQGYLFGRPGALPGG
ncbi:EAL domain-containing protein [Neoroseomonas oryzicola]|uniref:EAL domain-containing protein n=1 Tax=Neoroseomonas oryzicola TaxID=535904 RepID=A0A9X9WF02_9PROT|nr:EAL domain-containing protein [Neoroseomonas oryzicola]MBR0658912.1 EAL domain-containing protein [Neoroseomonas oryzicola]NKE15736.1 EAL domain-containing protein [Neoroseomonas oryzicola]